MRRRLLLEVFLAAQTFASLAWSEMARGDTVEGTRFEMRERVHAVAARLDRGTATLVVTRTVDNPGPKSDQALFFLDLPGGAVATRLRTAGVGAHGEPIWFEGDLMEAEEAAHKYQELTGIGGFYPKDPALLSWRSQQTLALQVFPVPAGATKTVEYTLRLPMTYERGGYKLTLTELGTEAMPANVRFSAAHEGDRVEVNGVGVGRDASVKALRELEVRLVPRSAPALEGALASFGFGDRRVLVHGRVAAAPRLSEPPANAAVVVLLDVSRSMEADTRAEVAAARAYVSQMPNARVEVMTFARTVSSPFGGALPASEVASRLAAWSPQPANGSALDDALAQADAKLERVPEAARRILVLTDFRTREALTPARFAARPLASGAVVHLASFESGGPSLVRDDDSPWANVPRKSGGLFWRASCDERVDANGRALFEQWVRPKQIDHLVVKGLPDDFVAPSELHEGEGLEHLAFAKSPSSQLSIEGELWSRPVRFSFPASAEEAKRWAALVFGTPLYTQLSEKEQMVLAKHGGAVSPVTSYLAIEPGVRPSTEGLEPGEVGHGSGTGTGQGFGSGHGRLAGVSTAGFDRQAFLDKALGSALDACKVKGAATATIESTIAEIVDVRSVALAPTRDLALERCVGERLWSVVLPPAFRAEQATWTVSARR